MLITALDTLVGAVITAEAAGGGGALTTCYDEVTLFTYAEVGFWLTLAAMTVIAAYHALQSPSVRGWIARQRMAWTLRHAASRPRRRYPAHRP